MSVCRCYTRFRRRDGGGATTNGGYNGQTDAIRRRYDLTSRIGIGAASRARS